MSSFFLKKIAAFFIAPVFLLFFMTKPDRVNFSGNWSLNEGKSDLGQFGDYVPRNISVSQKDDSITISRTSKTFNGDDVTNTQTMSYDGKETESTVFGSSKEKSSSKWSDDGQTLTITYTLLLDFNGQTNEIKGTEIWTLMDDGKTILEQNSSSSSFGDNSTKCYYEKK